MGFLDNIKKHIGIDESDNKRNLERLEQDTARVASLQKAQPKEPMTTRTLLQRTLAKMSIKYEFDDEQRFIVQYQGENLIISADNDRQFIIVHDGWWYNAPLDDIDNLSILYKAINEHNIVSGGSRIVYSIDNEDNVIHLHTLCNVFWIDAIPVIEEYFRVLLDGILYSHHLFYQIMERLRREDFARRI